MAETSNDEPLEPDAGNAAEGRGKISHAIPMHGFFTFMRRPQISADFVPLNLCKSGPRESVEEPVFSYE
jgi:hypothetical protein